MDRYYVSIKHDNNPSKYNEVHKVSCRRLPSMTDRIFIGYHNSCNEALNEASKYFPGNTDGCGECIPECSREKEQAIDN